MANYRITRNKNIATVEAPEATYTIIYGIHLRGQKVEHIPEDVDAIFLETGTYGWYDDPLTCVEKLKHHIQYRPIFETLERKKIPILFADLKYKFNDHLLLMADNMLAVLQWMAGLRMIRSIFDNRQKKRNGKSFLLRTGFAGWLLMPFAANMFHLVSSFVGKGETQTAAFKRFAHKLHPESDLLYLSLRNAVIAEKLVSYAKSFTNKPHIGVIIGAGHVGIEDMLTMTAEKRAQYVKNFKNLLDMVARKEYLSSFMTVNYQENNWKVQEVVEVASLKRII